MIVRQVCAKCKKLLGHVELGYDVELGTVSHGPCARCGDEILAEYKEESDDK